MILDPVNMFWDSCVFIRYITTEMEAASGSLGSFIKDAQDGRRTIYYSTIALTEIRPRFFKGTKYGNIGEFFDDMKSAFSPIEPNPNILIAAGELRDALCVNPGDPKHQGRVVGTPDSIHLMTCVFIRDTLEIPDIVFHTFDDGKGSTWEGKCIPLISFHRWYPEGKRTVDVQNVCSLVREAPVYPQPELNLGAR